MKGMIFMNFYISDLHIGHENVLKHDGRLFKNTDEMASEIIRRWNSVVTFNDSVYVLGDFAWKNIEGLEVLSQLVGKKYFILGNHDKLTNEMRAYFGWVKDIATVEDNGVQVVLCHYPVAHWRNQYRGAVHLYGHIHNTKDNTAFDRYREIYKELEIPFECYNVGCTMPYMDYTPRTLEEIRRTAGER